MFEDCKSLAELNKERQEAVLFKKDTIININKYYQEKKKDLILKAPAYRKINIYRPNLDIHTPYMSIPYAGPSDGRSLVYTQNGFKA